MDPVPFLPSESHAISSHSQILTLKKKDSEMPVARFPLKLSLVRTFLLRELRPLNHQRPKLYFIMYNDKRNDSSVFNF